MDRRGPASHGSGPVRRRVVGVYGPVTFAVGVVGARLAAGPPRRLAGHWPAAWPVMEELVLGAFIGMMRAHGEGRVALSDADRDLSEQARWDIIVAHARGAGRRA